MNDESIKTPFDDVRTAIVEDNCEVCKNYTKCCGRVLLFSYGIWLCKPCYLQYKDILDIIIEKFGNIDFIHNKTN
jgi:hypothetical protein